MSLPPIDDAFKARLQAIANGSEDAWMERKPVPSNDGRDIRRTLVAFANSVEEREFAVLLIGASDDLKHPGVKDPDELQKKVDAIATRNVIRPSTTSR